MSEKIDIISFSAANENLARQAFFIRQLVFVNEQGVDAILEYDEHDKTATHYLVTLNSKPIGAARWRKTENAVKLERFAILKEYRNKNIGAQLLTTVLGDVMSLNIPIYLHAQITAVKFYERHGFVKNGDTFYEAGIMHFKMNFEKKMN